jgi:hypothetical protein
VKRLRRRGLLGRSLAGMSWRELQDHLDPKGLAVKTMQSDANFSIGGAVSVNAHGRYVGHGPVGHSLRALQLVLADGRVIEASRSEHAARSPRLSAAMARLTEAPGGAALRGSIAQPLMNRAAVVQWLNQEASRDVAELEPEPRDHALIELALRHQGRYYLPYQLHAEQRQFGAPIRKRQRWAG